LSFLFPEVFFEIRGFFFLLPSSVEVEFENRLSSSLFSPSFLRSYLGETHVRDFQVASGVEQEVLGLCFWEGEKRSE